MYFKDRLIINRLPGISDDLFLDFRSKARSGEIYQGPSPNQTFIHRYHAYLESSTLVSLGGLDRFPYRHVTMGCNHYIDSIIIKHGLKNLQILEHDYRYYQRLDPDLNYATVGALRENSNVIVAAPFPGALDLHWQWNDLLDECDQKNISVHIDGAWLGLCKDLQIDLTRNCIKSIASSLSKGLGLSWNRVGVRWSKDTDPTDSISIMNQFDMIPEMLVRTGISALDIVPVDYLWKKYGEKYQDICQNLRLRPGKIINSAMSIDRKQLFGLADLLMQS